MTRYCPHCETGVLKKHRTFDNEEKWNCRNCDRVYREAGEKDVTEYNNISVGDLVLKQ